MMHVSNCQDSVDGDNVGKLPGVEDQLPGLGHLWSLSLGDPRVCVAVLDGPADLTHPAFDGAIVRQLDSLRQPHRTKGFGLQHGTHVASLIFGQHHSAVHGIAPKCRGVLVPIYGQRDDGSLVPCSQLDLARAISLAVAVGANVINLSAGVYDATGAPEPALVRALQMCKDQGILMVAAAGNDGCACPHVPAASPTVLVVGATDTQGRPAAFSNWAKSYSDHGVLAPGEAITVAVPGGGTRRATGTSLAAALVSGVAGLLASWQLRLGRGIDVLAIKTAILEGAVPCEDAAPADCQRWLRGKLEPYQAFSLISAGEASAMSNPNELQTVDDSTPLPEPVQRRTAELAGCGSSPPSVESVDSGLTQRGLAALRPVSAGPERQLVYALGQIGYDFGTEAKRDALFQADEKDGEKIVRDPSALLDFLQKEPWQATAVTWTLQQEATPLYALRPAGAFARETYERIRDLLKSQIEEGVTQVSIPGVLGPPVTLMNGMQVPGVFPDIRGMFGWSNPELIKHVLGKRPQNSDKQAEYDQLKLEIEEFLERLYYELANLGVAPSDRAINYAATNLRQVSTVYQDAIKKSLKLDKIESQRSQIWRPGADCWDVVLTLFDPQRRYERAREVYRLTIDVSEVIPVTVGKLRHWSVY